MTPLIDYTSYYLGVVVGAVASPILIYCFKQLLSICNLGKQKVGSV